MNQQHKTGDYVEQSLTYLIFGLGGVAALGGVLILLNQIWMGAFLLLFAIIMGFGKAIHSYKESRQGE